MPFCPNCGNEIAEDSVYCPSCNSSVPPFRKPNAGYQSSNQYENSMPIPGVQNYGQSQYNNIKQKIPGRGFGISSLVLGIIGLFFSSVPVISAIEILSLSPQKLNEYANSYVFGINKLEDMRIGVIANCFLPGILCILALIFSICAICKKYKNGISISGLVLSVLGVICCVGSLIIAYAR